MTWLPGQAGAPHDHSGSICAECASSRGRRSKTATGSPPTATWICNTKHRCSCGDVLAGQDAGVHTIRNPSKGKGLLVTIHVYSPPLRDIRIYRARPEPLDEDRRKVRDRPPTVVVVGGGFSGTMAAAQTLRRASQDGLALRVILVERHGAIGEGVAYSTREAVHLLNVPAGRIEHWPDRPDDFVRWASRRHGEVQQTAFLPRHWYGEYVREALLNTAEEAGDAVETEVVFDEVRRVARHPAGGWMVHLAREASLHADAVILTVGHRPPSDPIGLKWQGPRTHFIPDPWRPFATNVVGLDDPAVVLGSGLTAVRHGSLTLRAASACPDHDGLSERPAAAGPFRHAGVAGRPEFPHSRAPRHARRGPGP